MSTPKLIDQEDIWEDNAGSFTLIEEAKEVDGVHILAKVRGPAFFPETTSRNNVYYSTEAWENALADPDFQSRLNDRLVYGTIGHKIVLDDAAIREGKFSHIVTAMYINESGVGEAEYLVLNTPPGQILNTVLRAGSKMRVSTKAKGLFESNSMNGAKVINPKLFKVERIDFVLDAGYLKAHPDLLESYNLIDNDKLKEEPQMDQNDKITQILEARIKELKDEKGVTLKVAEELTSKVQEIGEALATAQATVASYAVLGDIVVIQESLTKLANYEKLGEPAKVEEALDKADDTINQLNDALEQSTLAVDESLNAEEITEELNKYREFGTPKELEEMVESAELLADKALNAKVKEIAAANEVDESVVKGFIDRGVDIELIQEMFSVVSLKSQEEIDEEKKKDELSTDKFKKEEIDESKDKSRASQVTGLASKLMS